MSAKWLTVGILVLLIVGGGIFVASRQDGATEETAEVGTVGSPAASPKSSGQAVADSSTRAGKYLDYSPEILEQTSGQRALFFHAPWCPQCRSVEAGIKQDGVPDGWTIIKVDYDSNQALRQKYGVKIQTTFVKIDGSGNRTGDNYVAYEKPDFSTVVANFLNP